MEGADFQLAESREKIGLMLAGLATVSFACWLALRFGGAPTLSFAGAGLIFCAVCGPLWLAAAFRPAVLRVDPHGIQLSSAFQRVAIDWSNVETIEKRIIWPSDNTRVVIGLARPQTVRRLFGEDSIVELNLNMTWSVSHDELVARLVEAKKRIAS